MSEVIVKLVGGLGNQMFQYAAARAVASRLGANLKFDLSWFGTDPDRQFALMPFNICVQSLSSDSPHALTGDMFSLFARRFYDFLGLKKGDSPVFIEHSFHYDSKIEQVSTPVFLEGYFQSQKYFYSVRDEIARDFTLRGSPSSRAQTMLAAISQCDAICLHIRRGDYVSNKTTSSYHGVCSLDYYKAGLDVAVKGLDSPHCFVFSDDMPWVRDNFKVDIPITLVDIHTLVEAHEDLRLMAACKRYVIANSSLSWWGAWLGSREGKVVVAPRKWFRSDKVKTIDLIPENWIQI